MQRAVLRRRQHGAAAVTAVALLMACIGLVVAFAHRSILVDLGASANDARSAGAFELAEAGIDWFMAHANMDTPLDPDCRTSTSGGRPPRAGASGFLARLGLDAAMPSPRVASCVASSPDADWVCQCPAPVRGRIVEPAAALTAGFALEPLPGPSPDVLVIRSTGCNAPAPTCLQPRAREGVAVVQLQVRRLPSFSADAIPDAPAAVPFEQLFRMPPSAFSNLPGVSTIVCSGDCQAPILAAWGEGHRAVRLLGDLVIDRPWTAGRPDRPLVLVVDGQTILAAPWRLYGLLHTRRLAAEGTGATDSEVHGALISASAPPPAPGVVLDRDELLSIARRTGPYLLVPGTWHEP